MAHWPHRRTKGCPMCKFHKFKDHGRAIRDPFNIRRKLGTKRRARRGEVPRDQMEA